MHKIAGEANRFKAGLIPPKKRARPATSTSSIRVPVEGRGLEFLWHNRAPNSGRDRERTRAQLGASVNSLHAFAHSDDLGGTAGGFLETALDRGSLTRQRRLLIRMTMSSANQCRSYMAHLRCQPGSQWRQRSPRSPHPTAPMLVRTSGPLSASYWR